MQEPLTVQVNRIKNGQYSPIPLPLGESGQAGIGWSKGEVLELNSGWLVKSWSGGGLYEFTVTDATQPSPQTCSWRSWWATTENPELIPPPLAGGQFGVLASPSSAQQHQQSQLSLMGQFANG